MQHDDRLSAEEVYKLLHDLRGPVANAKVLGIELSDSIADLRAAIENSRPGLSDENHKLVDEIIAEDIVACTNLLAASVNKLSERIEEIEERYAA